MPQDFAVKLNDKIELEYQVGFDAWLQQQEPGWFKVTFAKKKDIRSLKQNNYWWAVMMPALMPPFNKHREAIGKDTFDKYQVSDTFKLMYGLHGMEKKAFKDEETGKISLKEEVVLISTSKYSTKEFMALWEKCYQFAAEEWNIYIPDPDPNWRSKSMKIIEKVLKEFDGEIVE